MNPNLALSVRGFSFGFPGPNKLRCRPPLQLSRRRSHPVGQRLGSRAENADGAETAPVPVDEETLVANQQDQGSMGGIVAGIAVAFGVGLFAATRLVGNDVSIATLQAESMQLDVARANHKPTVIEFYANWCEVCKETAADTYEVEQQFKDDINFVMLNIDNTKWSEEMVEYRVNGIPEYVFLDGSGTEKAIAVGRVPRDVLQGDAEALKEGRDTLPFAAVRRQASTLPSNAEASIPSPRDHA